MPFAQFFKINGNHGPAVMSIGVLALLAACSPSATATPTQPVLKDQMTQEQNGISNKLPVFQPARGVNADMLFAEKLADPDARFQRLENTVAELKRQIDILMPSAEISDAPPVDLTVPDATEILKAPPQSKMVEPPKPKAAHSAKTKTTTEPAVKAIRTGQHEGGILRLVLDLTAPAKYNLDLDNNEKLLLIELPKAKWTAVSQGQFKKTPMVTSWSSESIDGNGSRLILQLNDEVQIVKETTLENPARIALDLKKSP